MTLDQSPVNCFPASVRARFEEIGEGDVIASLEAGYHDLLNRHREYIQFGDPRHITEAARARANGQVLRQSLLHRAERLIVSSGTMINENNFYGLALMVRGHFEATAMLGYFCHRMWSFAAGNISFDDITWNLATALMGAKHEQFKDAPNPINIMTCIEKADRYLENMGFPAGHGMISDCYAWLSDCAHPNFLSMGSAIVVDDQIGGIRIRHNMDLRREEMTTLGYLDISAKLFLQLFDDFAAHSDNAFQAQPGGSSEGV